MVMLARGIPNSIRVHPLKQIEKSLFWTVLTPGRLEYFQSFVVNIYLNCSSFNLGLNMAQCFYMILFWSPVKLFFCAVSHVWHGGLWEMRQLSVPVSFNNRRSCQHINMLPNRERVYSWRECQWPPWAYQHASEVYNLSSWWVISSNGSLFHRLTTELI